MTTLTDILLDDLEAIFGEHGWAVDAVYRLAEPAEGEDADRDVRVIFDNAFQDVDPKSQAPIGSTGPAAFLRAADLPADLDDIEEEDRLIIVCNDVSQAYRIVVARPDGHGSVFCRLQKVSA